MPSDPPSPFEALTAAIQGFRAGDLPVSHVIPAECGCGSEVFALVFDDVEGVAARLCSRCESEYGIADSDEHADEVEELFQGQCPCGGEEFRTATGFAVDDDGEVRWVSVGGRCEECGQAGVFVDWKIDYLPSRHLLAQA